MEKIKAEEAVRLASESNKMKEHYFVILDWVFQMIKKNANEGYWASRLNLPERKQFFDKHIGEGWGVWNDTVNWELVIEKLSKELKGLGYGILNTKPEDYHIAFKG